jgi:hypothetical protein
VSDSATVLGLVSRGDDNRLSMWLVELQLDEDGQVKVAVHEPWYATKKRDDASQLIDAHDVIANAIDASTLGTVNAVAVKRTETPPFGRPGNAYDRKIRFEGAAMLAAHTQGKRYYAYRNNQLGRGEDIAKKARSANGAPKEGEALEAMVAACAGLSDLSKSPAD